jgi:hypothetical protein
LEILLQNSLDKDIAWLSWVIFLRLASQAHAR